MTQEPSGASSPPRLSFVIPVRNDSERLARCLLSIARAAQGYDVEVVVVDNGSDDDSRQIAESMGATVLCVRDVPVSRLRNEGVAVTRATLLAFVDADHEIADHWVAAALARFADPTVAAAGADYHPPVDSTWVQRVYDRFRSHASEATDTQWLASGNLIVRREVFDVVRGFDARLHACEDVDFCARLRRAGFRLVNDPALHSAHLGDPESLRLLFMSELWRGRNNMSVTLGSERSWRSIVSLTIPAVNLMALTGLIVGAAWGAWNAVVAAVLIILGLGAARAAMMLRGRRFTAWSAVECVAVAIVYHTARALALVWPARHRRARLPLSVAVKSVR